MKFKIIETCSDYPNVLLYRDRDAEGIESVNILAVGAMEGSDNMFATEYISFGDSYNSAENFIRDYSLKSAEDFCINNGITYAP